MNRLSLLLAFLLSLFLIITCYSLQPEEDVEEQTYSSLFEPEYDYEKQVVEAVPETSEEPTPGIEDPEQNDSLIIKYDESPPASDLSFECPASRSDLPSQILHRKGYIVSYNKDTMQPNWAAWHLTAEHTDGEWARPSGNAFHEDTEVPAPRASNYDYKGSGWTRGHMCPAGDNRWDADAMYESFLLSNICPQHTELNSGDWNDIEQECRRWAGKYGDIYIVCGPIFYRQTHEEIGYHKIPVPEAFFKVVLCLNSAPKGIGFICKNTDGNRKTDFYVNTIAQVERITGYIFFPQLSENIASAVKGTASLEMW